MRGCRNLRFDCLQKYASLSEFSSFISQPAQFYSPCMITISEPHYLLFYSADCKYTAVIDNVYLYNATFPAVS